MTRSIEPMREDHWDAVRKIYEEGIAGGNATFETETPAFSQWDARHHQKCRLVLKIEEEIAGWAALSPVSSRAVYTGVAEVSVYVSARHQHQGIGSALLDALIRESEQAGFWTLQASIFPENEASIGLHRKHGFRVVGRRERIAQRQGVWRDTVLMERRAVVT